MRLKGIVRTNDINGRVHLTKSREYWDVEWGKRGKCSDVKKHVYPCLDQVQKITATLCG